mmetsp:Transcript_36648/g.95982  ORF Transcript_36648/g.95982 Transcript_36648/m.95982 type:complete len:191 (+) Transcript_36648:127-699(+)
MANANLVKCVNCNDSGRCHPAPCSLDYCQHCESGAPCYSCVVYTREEITNLANHLEFEIGQLSALTAADLEARFSDVRVYDDNPQRQAKLTSEYRVVLTSTTKLPMQDGKVRTFEEPDPGRPFPVPCTRHKVNMSTWATLKRRVCDRFQVDISTLYVYHVDGNPLGLSVYVARLGGKALNIEIFFHCTDL